MSDKLNLEGLRLWSGLIPMIEDILKSDVSYKHKCDLIKLEINYERNKCASKDTDTSEVKG